MLDVHSGAQVKWASEEAVPVGCWCGQRGRGGEAEGPREAGAVPAASLDSMRRSEKARVLDNLFLLPEWLSCNSGNLPHFAFVLRALLTNAPNSCPPERGFSMFNATFGEDQGRSFGDYLALAMQSQYNKRNL